MLQSKKDLAVRRASLQAHQVKDDDDDKPVPPVQVASAPILVPANAIRIDDNDDYDDNLNDQVAEYANTLIYSNR